MASDNTDEDQSGLCKLFKPCFRGMANLYRFLKALAFCCVERDLLGKQFN